MMRRYASFGGFKYWIKPKLLLGAYVAMEAFARGLLEYGDFDEYHAYHGEEFFRTLSKEEVIRAFFRCKKLKVMKFQDLVRNPGVDYRVLHTEEFGVGTEVILRNTLSQRNIPSTRRVYTIATNGHLLLLLDICALGGGGRPYDSIIVPSRAARDVLTAYMADVSAITSGSLSYKGRVDVIPHGIWLEQFPPRDKCRSREKHAIPCQATVLLSMARISWTSKMNYDRLLAFFARLTKRTPADLLLVIAGSDPKHESQEVVRVAQELGIAGKLKIITDFADEDKADILNCADIFISLSDNLQESFGITVIEAMAMGLPVVCTDWDGYKDIVDDGVTGYRIPTTWKVTKCPQDVLAGLTNPYSHSVIHRISRGIRIDMDLLLARTLELINHEDMRRTMGGKGREKAKRMYSVKTEISRFQALWRELGEMAARDKNEYQDLGRLLNYDYPRHFRGYPTRFDQAILDPASSRQVPGEREHQE